MHLLRGLIGSGDHREGGDHGQIEVLSLIGWSEAFEVIPEGIKIDNFPCPIIPAVTALNIVAMVISFDVEPDASVVVACDRSSIDIDGDLLVSAMVN